MTTLLAGSDEPLWGRYVVEREIHRGEVATTYVARDLMHGRRVVLKVLRPEVASSFGLERFRREIRIAAGLIHPHIVPLRDTGIADGVPYYVTPYVEGESLRDRLRRERQLPLHDALTIARQVASALQYAHGRGVIHRAVRPENVLLHEGQALLKDFGIAVALDVMSPEQAAADRELDGRSDIYSLGCVLYEMLVGDPPFAGTSAKPVPSPRTFRDAVPEAIERVVMRALAATPTDRYATAEEFAQALDPSARRSGRPSVARRWTMVLRQLFRWP
jgi:serine/threonine protein kinase